MVGFALDHRGMDDMPFLGSEALERGDVTRNDLRTRYRALYRDAYLPKDARELSTTCSSSL